MKRMAVIVSIFLLLAAIYVTAYSVDQVRPVYMVEDYLYLTKFNKLKGFAFGFEGEYADFLWLMSLQSFHKRMLEKYSFDKIFEVYDTITDLDPYFQEAYDTGALYIAMAIKSSQRGIELLENGTKKVPNEPWIWKMLGRMYYLERFLLEKKNEMTRAEATKKAVEALATAIKLGGDSETRNWLNHIGVYDKFATFDTISWLQIYEESQKNQSMQQVALRRLQRHIVHIHQQYIDELLAAYRQKHGKLPQKLAELPGKLPKEPQEKEMETVAVALLNIIRQQSKHGLMKVKNSINQYIIKGLATSGVGKPYYYAADSGKVLAYSIEEQDVSRVIAIVYRYLYRFKDARKRWPKSLEELVSSGLVKLLPKLPPWREYVYDPEQGIVETRKKND